jgi:hypothetical protein
MLTSFRVSAFVNFVTSLSVDAAADDVYAIKLSTS